MTMGGCRSPYDASYFRRYAEGSLRSARAVLPHVLRLVEPRSVVDFGCGIGTWLAVALELGVADVLGVDGAHLDPNELLVPQDRFRRATLDVPIDLGRRFDLALCLEVAEHMAPEAAPVLVDTLTRHADAVLFSAAIPFQGGTDHVNEQWPDYWAAKFEVRGYMPIDCVRPTVWCSPDVEYWYAQNTLLYARHELIASRPALRAAYERNAGRPLSVVHPRQFYAVLPAQPLAVADGLRALASALKARLVRRPARPKALPVR